MLDLSEGFTGTNYLDRMYLRGRVRISGVISTLSRKMRPAPANKLFDPTFHAAQVSASFASPAEAFAHFLEDRNATAPPHPVFDIDYIASQRGQRTLDARTAWEAVLDSTAAPHVSPHRLFDPALYLRNLPEDARREARRMGNPILHFLDRWHEYRVPFSPYFDAQFYFAATPGLSPKVNPLDHYARRDLETGADANPMFHSGYYRKAYGRAGPDMLSDFLAFGCAMLHLPNPWALQELGEAPLSPDTLLSYIEV